MADLRDVNLNRLAIFVAVVDAGSLTAAAERLGLAKTVVRTHMQRLESEVGANLLVRTTRRLSVTDAGGRSTTRAATSCARRRKRARRGVVRRGAAARHAARERADRLRRAGRRACRRRIARPASGASTSNSSRTTAWSISSRTTSTSRSASAASPIRNYRAVQLGTYEKWLVAVSRVRCAPRTAARAGCARRAAVRDAVVAAARAYGQTGRRERQHRFRALHRAGRVEHRHRVPRDRARGRRLPGC